MEKYTLFELNEYIRRVLALNLPDPLWISCEIAQVGTAKGHYYLSLVQKGNGPGELSARAEAVLWQRQARQIQRKAGNIFPALLQEGMEVLLLASVDFHERYGLKLIIQDIDPAYTLGQLELRRREIMQRLESEQLIGKNRRQLLPGALQHIAVITSERAAGLQDFLQHLQENPYGYQFSCKLYPAAVQGEQVSAEVSHQLHKIAKQRWRFDCVAIIRGGGARLDLAAFDDYEICKTVAGMPLPVLSGIGHEVDEVLLDKVVHTALKTPTAVADFIVGRNMQFESGLLQLGQQLSLLAAHRVRDQAVLLERIEQALRLLPRQRLHQQQLRLQSLAEDIPRSFRRRARAEHQQLGQMEQLMALLSPESTLKRGFSIIYKDGKAITSAKELDAGSQFTARLRDGDIQGEVKGSTTE